MARTFYLSSTNSDLTGGADFNLELATSTAASSPLAVTVAPATTETSRGFTASTIPGTGGATGNYTVEVNVTSANANIQLAITLHRVNSGGTVQTSSSASAEQSLGSTGVKTFTFTAQSLGTWASGDRLRVDYAFRSTAAHGTNSVTIDRNTTDSEVVTPFTPPPQSRNIGQVSQTSTAQPVAHARARAVGLLTATETAQAIGRAKQRRVNRTGAGGSVTVQMG